MRTRTRVALLFFLITVTVMMLFSFVVYYFSTQYTFSDFYRRLKTRAALAARIQLENDPGTSPYSEMRENILEKLPKEIDYFFEPSINLETASDSLGLPLSFFKTLLDQGTAEYQEENTFFSGLLYHAKDRSIIAIVSAENYYYSHHVANLRKIILIAFILISTLVLSISFTFSKYLFEPIKQITQQVRDINSRNLHLRLHEGGINDEVKALKMTFNTMLDRLEASFATQNNFISNASHELSTPLTAIIGEADVALSKERQATEYRNTIRTISRQAERLEQITKSLLFLAQTGFDGVKQKFETIRIDQLLWNVKETTEQMNPKNIVRLNMSLMPENPELLKIQGIEHLLHLALTNIVSNGCQYSSHKPVDISIGISDCHVVILIVDKGIGIPSNEIQFIYDPFFRASNTKDYEGYGIGLPLTRNIVRIHKGTIRVTSHLNEGTVVEVSFPIKS